MNATMKQVGKLLGQVLVFLLIVTVVRLYVQRDAVHGSAPEFEGILLNGQTVSLRDYHGGPVLVHFWATWCGICRLEQGSIDDIARDHAVLTIAMQSGDRVALQRYMHEQQLRYDVLPDPDGYLAGRYGASAVPASFVLDASGHIRFVEFGYTTEIGLRARLWLTRVFFD